MGNSAADAPVFPRHRRMMKSPLQHGFLALALAFPLAARQHAAAQTFQEMYAFRGAGAGDGTGPRDTLIQGRDGNFYGTTTYGGAFTDNGNRPWGLGTVFKMTQQGMVTILASFNGTNGMYPIGGLVE